MSYLGVFEPIHGIFLTAIGTLSLATKTKVGEMMRDCTKLQVLMRVKTSHMIRITVDVIDKRLTLSS